MAKQYRLSLTIPTKFEKYSASIGTIKWLVSVILVLSISVLEEVGTEVIDELDIVVIKDGIELEEVLGTVVVELLNRVVTIEPFGSKVFLESLNSEVADVLGALVLIDVISEIVSVGLIPRVSYL